MWFYTQGAPLRGDPGLGYGTALRCKTECLEICMRHALIALILIATPACAAERTHDITPADYFSLATITEIAVSPDGKHVAYALATWDKADDLRKSDLWLAATDGQGKPRRLTFDRANDQHPKWS